MRRALRSGHVARRELQQLHVRLSSYATRICEFNTSGLHVSTNSSLHASVVASEQCTRRRCHPSAPHASDCCVACSHGTWPSTGGLTITILRRPVSPHHSPRSTSRIQQLQHGSASLHGSHVMGTRTCFSMFSAMFPCARKLAFEYTSLSSAQPPGLSCGPPNSAGQRQWRRGVGEACRPPAATCSPYPSALGVRSAR